jgi:hypothetical protein
MGSEPAGDWRALTADEVEIIERLLERRFDGRDELLAQVPLTVARAWEQCVEHCGSIELFVRGGELSASREVEHPIPIEGRVLDDDGLPIQLLLFQRGGQLRHLEYVVFSDRRKREIRAIDIEIVDQREARRP